MINYLYILLLGLALANNPPVSDQGSDFNVGFDAEVTLDGSKSYDLDGDPLTYKWSSNSSMQLSSDTAEQPTFTAPNSESVLTFNLTVNDGVVDSDEYSAKDLFISEYHDAGSNRNKYLEIFNGTGADVDLTGYEVWIVERGKSAENGDYEAVLLFNSDVSLVDSGVNTTAGDRVTNMIIDPLRHDGTLAIIKSDGILNEDLTPEFEIEGLTIAVMPFVYEIVGRQWVGLFKDGVLIDRFGDENDPGSSPGGWSIAGEDAASKDGVLVRKSTVISGNVDWAQSAGTSFEDSEWLYYEQDTFDDAGVHSCSSCDSEVTIYVYEAPEAVAYIDLDGLLYTDLPDYIEVCDTEITLDASESTSPTGEISYLWIDDNGLISAEDLTKKRPSFSTIDALPGIYSISLVVNDTRLNSTAFTLTFSIADNLCPKASASVASIIDDVWIDSYSTILIFDEEEFIDQGNGSFDMTNDANGDGLCCLADGDECEVFYDIGDFVYTCSDPGWEIGQECEEGEDYIDCNSNGYYDNDEPFVDMGNGCWDEEEQFVDIGDGLYTPGDPGEDFIDINGNGQWDNNQVVYLSGLGSTDADGEIADYIWDSNSVEFTEIEGTNGAVVSFIRPSFGVNNYGELEFTLSVVDAAGATSEPNYLMVKFAQPSKPDMPFLSTRVEHEAVILSWGTVAENSVDSLTGYYDFEGYRLYKSIDGGDTWGDANDKIYNDKGQWVGWKPFMQWDFNEAQDNAHCNFSSGFCSSDNRGVNIEGYDPYSYWVNIGENTGLVHSFLDTNVVDGVEYTYALTSYDTGVWTTYIDPTITLYGDAALSCDGEDDGDCIPAVDTTITSEEECSENEFSSYADDECTIDYWAAKKAACEAPYPGEEGIWDDKGDFDNTNDQCIVNDCREEGGVWGDGICTMWYSSNPSKFLNVNGLGFSTMESDIDDEGGRNYSTVLPGYFASNVYFPSEAESDTIFYEDPDNRGTGLVSYQLVNMDELQPIKVQFEVQARMKKDSNGNETNSFENLKTGAPTLYAYYVDDDGQPLFFDSGIPYAGLLNSERDSLLDLPGAFLNVDDNVIVLPDYEVEGMDIKFFDDFDSFSNWSDFISGTRMRFLNPFREYGLSKGAFVNYSDLNDPIVYVVDGTDYLVPIIGEKYFPENLHRRINYSLKYNFTPSDAVFDERPPYTYSIEFIKDSNHRALEVDQAALGDDCGPFFGSDCGDSATLLPFRVLNKTTGKYVGLRHIDKGYNNGGNAEQPLFTPATLCEGIIPGSEDVDNYTGDCDGVWTTYEDIVFVSDTVTTRLNPVPHPEITLTLELSYDFMVQFGGFLDVDPWNDGISYDVGAYVLYGGTKWINDSADDIAPGVQPGSGEVNPWSAIYPWDDFNSDSIYVDIEPWTWFADGDNWIADLSLLGQVNSFDESDLEKITVSPNPYLGSSGYNESPGENKIRFSNLPNECEINIFTASGERVKRIKFSDDLYGNYFWNLKNAKGEKVAPGLYIYTVEGGRWGKGCKDDDIGPIGNCKEYEFKHIGKFAIVR